MIRLAILTISAGVSAGTRENRSGPAIDHWATGRTDVQVTARAVVPDEVPQIAAQLIAWADGDVANLVVTTGGTGLGPRDVTPEATRTVLERDIPGIPEALRAAGRATVSTAPLGRGIAGTRRGTLIINLPGSLAAVRDGLQVLDPLLEHAVQLLAGHTEH